MINEADLKIFRIVDAQEGKSLQETSDWLSKKLRDNQTAPSMEQGYKNMAGDEERDQEASEWIEDTLITKEL